MGGRQKHDIGDHFQRSFMGDSPIGGCGGERGTRFNADDMRYLPHLMEDRSVESESIRRSCLTCRLRVSALQRVVFVCLACAIRKGRSGVFPLQAMHDPVMIVMVHE